MFWRKRDASYQTGKEKKKDGKVNAKFEKGKDSLSPRGDQSWERRRRRLSRTFPQ